MKKVFLFIVIGFSAYLSNAQNFEVPRSFDPGSVTEYTQYNKDVVACVNWLESTPMDKEKAKRKDANTFLINWISGSPDVMITLKPEIITFLETNPELVSIYMGGWTKYSIETGKYADSVGGNLAAIRDVIKVYKMNKTLKREKDIEKLIDLDSKGKLEAYEEKLITNK